MSQYEIAQKEDGGTTRFVESGITKSINDIDKEKGKTRMKESNDQNSPNDANGHANNATVSCTENDGEDKIFMDEMELCHKFACSCTMNRGEKCSTYFTADEYWDFRAQFKSLTTAEQDFCINCKLCALTNVSKETERSHKKNQTKRLHPKTMYMHQSRVICRDTFLFIHSMGKTRLSNLIKHTIQSGLGLRIKKAGGRTKRAYGYEDYVRIQAFLESYGTRHGLHVPGRVPGYKRDGLMLLPAHATKIKVYDEYKKEIAQHPDARVMNLTSFKTSWKTLMPHLIIGKPITDVCRVCQKNNNLIYKSANMSDQEKLSRLEKQRAHLKEAHNGTDSTVRDAMLDQSKGKYAEVQPWPRPAEQVMHQHVPLMPDTSVQQNVACTSTTTTTQLPPHVPMALQTIPPHCL